MISPLVGRVLRIPVGATDERSRRTPTQFVSAETVFPLERGICGVRRRKWHRTALDIDWQRSRWIDVVWHLAPYRSKVAHSGAHLKSVRQGCGNIELNPVVLGG